MKNIFKTESYNGLGIGEIPENTAIRQKRPAIAQTKTRQGRAAA
jgi:hypothetical protein